MLRGKRERRADPYYCTIDTTGFAAIMIVLLAIMIVPHMTINHFHSTSVDLPKVSRATTQQRAMREDAIKIAITHDGKLYFATDQISPMALHELITQAVQAGADRKVYIQADARVQYGVVQDVIDEVRAAGIENIVFFAREKNPSVLRP